MRHSPIASAVLAFLAVVVGGAQTSPAWASHYALADVPTLVSSDQATKLGQAGINTTEELLGRASKGADRKALAKTTGLSAAVLLDLAQRCDLLRIKGVGPEMVLLLEAAGVRRLADLAKADAATIASKVSAANQTKKISQKPPTEAQFQYWIGEAQKMPVVLQTK